MFLRSYFLATLLLCAAVRLDAHCDGLDGPVVVAAQEALASGKVEGALIWVQARDESEVRAVFAHTLAVRALSPEARELADRFFFETLVRVHRTGEGAAYTGLKPAGRDLGPAIPAADKAISSQDLKATATLLEHSVRHGLEQRFQALLAAKAHAAESVEAGRHYVATYVTFVHYVEGLHAAATAGAGHHAEAGATQPPVAAPPKAVHQH